MAIDRGRPLLALGTWLTRLIRPEPTPGSFRSRRWFPSVRARRSRTQRVGGAGGTPRVRQDDRSYRCGSSTSHGSTGAGSWSSSRAGWPPGPPLTGWPPCSASGSVATVGYTTRDDRATGAETRIEVVTEGILTRRLQNDPELSGVGAVLFDEFHERNLQTDLGLALTLDVGQSLRPDLRVLLMSATIDADRHFGGAGRASPWWPGAAGAGHLVSQP